MKGQAYEPTAQEIRAAQADQERIRQQHAKEREEEEKRKAEEEARVLASIDSANAGLFDRLKDGLSKTRDNFVSNLDMVFSGASAIDDDFYEELEEILIMGDVGVHATEEILDRLRDQVKEKKIKDPMDCKELLIESIREQMSVGQAAYDFETKQSVVLIIGVNGVGKTTSVGKLASKLK
ncbi:MAG: signal recognition particle receptor subunit alpha, partial [Lachnospiraceae bacterium]|nr:signal recognition particle receptor subunit alpha [Lachnospiraceae bacterium]